MIAEGWQAYTVWAAVCAVATLVSLVGEYRVNTWLSGAAKFIAAASYIAAALSLGATQTDYGRVLLAGMAFCWLGDMCLVSRDSRRLFLAGLVSFLLGHVVYTAAFAVRGISVPAAIGAGALMAVFGWLVVRWLEPGLDAHMRRPVWLYVIAICVMMTMAAATFAFRSNWPILLGGLLFVISDLSVARNRFVAPGIVNRVWGLPLYFAAQLSLAASVAL